MKLLDRTTYRTHEQARLEVFELIDAWYNRRRRHQSLGYLRPAQFEAAMCGSASPAEPRVDRFRRTEGAGV